MGSGMDSRDDDDVSVVSSSDSLTSQAVWEEVQALALLGNFAAGTSDSLCYSQSSDLAEEVELTCQGVRTDLMAGTAGACCKKYSRHRGSICKNYSSPFEEGSVQGEVGVAWVWDSGSDLGAGAVQMRACVPGLNKDSCHFALYVMLACPPNPASRRVELSKLSLPERLFSSLGELIPDPTRACAQVSDLLKDDPHPAVAGSNLQYCLGLDVLGSSAALAGLHDRKALLGRKNMSCSLNFCSAEASRCLMGVK